MKFFRQNCTIEIFAKIAKLNFFYKNQKRSFSVKTGLTCSESDDDECSSNVSFFVPGIRSGRYADIGPRRSMEDEHICIEDLSSRVGSLHELPKPSAYYAVFYGHGGPEAAAYFPQTFQVNSVYVEEVKSSLRNVFLQAYLALAEDRNSSSSSGNMALAGDCRAVL
ncbi:unnamed protein product [Eruca vesicaria subsp. sativa]|uniref:PPM-type phosphatase domain-containing protein n=1 Tax=Eruca vesicaria subsp. sativa TaxID=29727 RepID=A0ABC8JMC9_ERUVS|nr:unnamed protein product [Eruca vesicaria subsp. sativa]